MPQRDLTLILVAGAILRIAAAMLLPDQASLLTDANAYREAGIALAETGIMPTPYWMPLYSAIYALLQDHTLQIAADIAVSTATIWLVFQLSLTMFADRRAAMLAAAVTAFYPTLIFFAVAGLSETLYVALVVAAFLSWYKDRFMVAAIFAVLAILTRAPFDIVAPVMAVCFTIFVFRRSPAAALRNIGIYLLVYIALMSPWWLHNYAKYDTFVRLTPTAGIVLYIGNNPKNTSGGGNIPQDADLSQFAHITDDIERSEAMADAALSYIAQNPLRAIEGAVRKLARMWRPWPYNAAYRSWLAILAVAMPFITVAGLSLLYLFRWGRAEFRIISPPLAFIAIYTAIHMVMVGTIRYRLPLEPFMIVFAGTAFSRILSSSLVKARLSALSRRSALHRPW